MNFDFKTPVVLLMFNRPALTRRVFERIREAKPPKLLVVADGPRATHPDDIAKCAEVRKIVDEGVDWPCEVLRNYADSNLGCKRRVASGLDWVFHNVEEAIILEDDCLPHPTFFRYCQELLERYRGDSRVAMIAGARFNDAPLPEGDSCYFSRYPCIWGWASWRRFWEHYDVEMKQWPEFRNRGCLRKWVESRGVAKTLEDVFDATHNGGLDTWDHQLTLVALAEGMLTIMPRVNLVENIGFGMDSTHTKSGAWAPPVDEVGMVFPLKHPEAIVRNAGADDLDEKKYLIRPSRFDILRMKLKKALSLIALRK